MVLTIPEKKNGMSISEMFVSPGKDVRIYRISRSWRAVFAVVLASAMALAGWLTVALSGGSSGSAALGCISGGGFILCLAYVLQALFRIRIEIHHDMIRKVGFFRTTELRLDEIGGFRILPTSYARTLLLLPNASGDGKMKIELILERQKELLDWLKSSLTDLDAAEIREEVTEILNDEQLGETRDERLQILIGAKKWARILNGLGFAVMLWTIVKPEPYRYAVWASLILPLTALGLMRRFHGVLRFDGKPKSAYPNIGAAFILPCLGLALRVLLDFNILNWNAFWLPFAGISLSVYVLVLWFAGDARQKPARAILRIFVCALYGCVSVVSLNGTLDTSSPSLYKARVLGKRASIGRHPSYYLKLSPWGPKNVQQEVDVGKRVYEKRRVGDHVDVVVRQGKFGIPWFFVL